VNTLPEAILHAVDTAGCSPFVLNLEDVSNYNGSLGNLYRWYVEGVMIDTTPDPQLSLSIAGSYDVALSVTDRNGCSDDTTVKDLLTVHPVPVAGFLLSDSVVSEYDAVITFSDASSCGDWMQWDFGDGSISFESSVSHTYLYPGTYPVTQYVKTDFECADTLSRSVLVEAEPSIYLPSAFTPNGDGRNDVFKAEGRQVDDFRLYVFNRWGSLIFYSADIDNGWDGTFDGSYSQQDVYDYLVEYSTSREKNQRKTGKVMLLR
jgi:gliding motility-associated-like protein